MAHLHEIDWYTLMKLGGTFRMKSVTSIYSSSPNGICMSIKRLSQKLNHTSYQIELLALYIHELSHLYGATENDAVELQNKIKTLGIDFKKFISFLKNENTFDLKLNELILQIQSINTGENLNSLQLCNSLNLIYENSRKFFTDYNVTTQEILKLDLNKIINFHTIFVLSGYAKDYCAPENDLIKIFKRQKYFLAKDTSNNLPVSISKLYPDPLMLMQTLSPDDTLKLSQYLLADLSSNSIFWVEHYDLSALNANLKQMKSLVEELK